MIYWQKLCLICLHISIYTQSYFKLKLLLFLFYSKSNPGVSSMSKRFYDKQIGFGFILWLSHLIYCEPVKFVTDFMPGYYRVSNHNLWYLRTIQFFFGYTEYTLQNFHTQNLNILPQNKSIDQQNIFFIFSNCDTVFVFFLAIL